MLTKTELIRVLEQYNIRPQKKWGQNFLIDKNIKNKIIEAAQIKKSDFVLEIGPGAGALTDDLARSAGRVLALEKDRGLCRILSEMMRPYNNVTVLEGDILDFELDKLKSTSIKVIGNLPYYITTPIILRLLEFRKRIDFILITVQKEVAERICAAPGTKDYGSLSLYVLFYTVPAIEMNIKKDSFFPRPDVDSSLVKLKIRDKPPVAVGNEALLFEIIRASFGQRRKTLIAALSHKGIASRLAIERVLDSTGIDLKRRGETLSLEEFGKIADGLDNS